MTSYPTNIAPAIGGTADAVSFRLPASFDPAEFLPSRLTARFDDARYLVSVILGKFARRDVDDRGMVRLKAEFLRRVMHFRDYSRVVEALIEGGAVVVYPSPNLSSG